MNGPLRSRVSFGFFLLFPLICPRSAISAESFQSRESWKAGTAVAVITPSEPMWMAGYATRKKPSKGKVQDLFAKVLVLQDCCKKRVAICTVDLIGAERAFRDQVAGEIKKRYGIPQQAFLLSYSHTHCGPELRLSKAALGELSEERFRQVASYRNRLKNTICKLVERALKNLEPVRVRYSFARAGFAMNRRLRRGDKFVIGPNPEGPVDHIVPVLRIDRIKEGLLAVLFSYACHNTTLNFYKFCGDYAGYAQQYLEQAHPTSTALFMSGCAGDQNPYPRRKLRYAKQHGRALANAVEAALLAPGTEVKGPLYMAFEEIKLPFARPPRREELLEQLKSENPYVRKRASVLLEELKCKGKFPDSYPFTMQAIQFGDSLTLVAFSGEVVVEYSLALKEKLGEKGLWIVAYCNDVFGYVPTARQLEEGGYEPIESVLYYSSLPAPFAPSLEKLILNKTCKLVRNIRSRAKKESIESCKCVGGEL